MFQELIVNEINKAMDMLLCNEYSRYLSPIGAKCHCPFYRKYLLPCKDMFLLDMKTSNGWFTEETWQQFYRNGGEVGFDFYAAYERQTVAVQSSDTQLVDENVLQFHSVMEGFRDKFWRLKDCGSTAQMQHFISSISTALHR
jgi:hypothetical protein